MAWVRIDDQFPDHPKVVQAGPLAAWLYVCGLAYANRYLTDGHIPLAQVRRLADIDDACELAASLVDAGLWEPTADGYLIHDYHDYQPSAEEVRSERDAARERMRRVRSRPRTDVRANDEECSGEVQANNTGSSANPVPIPVPNPVNEPDPEPTPERARVGAPTPTAGHIAEILVQAPWVGDELPAVIRAVERSLTLVPGFNGARDGPLLAEQFVRWKGYRRKPPDDWYRAWLNWLKREPKEHDEGTNGHRNGARPADRRGAFDPASQTGGDEEAAIRAYLDGTPGAVVAGIKHD